MRRNPAGGRATATGMNFQYRAAAWVAVKILAEKDVSPPWDLPADTTLDWLWCETGQPVDDMMVGTSADGFMFCQIRHTLVLSQNAHSDLASALDQCVHQFIAHRSMTDGTKPWERHLDPDRDRLVIITGPNSSWPVRILPVVLQRLRRLVSGQRLEDAAVNDQERRSLSVVIGHIRRSWEMGQGAPPTDEELRQVLSLICVHVLYVEDGLVEEREAKDCLRTAVLRNPDQADTAWSRLITLGAELAQERASRDRIGLQQDLLSVGIALRAVRSYRSDIERLKDYSQKITDLLADLARIRIGATEIKLHRRSTEELRRAAEEYSLLVVGEPGAGKSGALYDLVRMASDEGRDVVFLAVDRLAARSVGDLRNELGIDHELVDVLKNWLGTKPAFLVIDALDAAREEYTARMIRDLIRLVVDQGDRWRVVASIRKFDLRYSQELRQLFSGIPPTEFRDTEFSDICHIRVPRFMDEELAQVGDQSPELHELFVKVPPVLREILRVPFNLRLMAELLGAGVDPNDLTPIRSQIELLDRYWSYRVMCSDNLGDAREDVLRRACEEMVRNRTLRVERSSVADITNSAHLNDLLSSQILSEWQPSPTALPERYILTFSHHMLFDYVTARFLLRGTDESFINRLTNDPELVLVIRPSLVLHFHYLWMTDPHRNRFWDLILRMMRAEAIREIGRLVGPSVAVELARDSSDLEPLFAAIESPDEKRRNAAEGALRHFVGSLAASDSGRPLAGPDAGPWCGLLERVSRNLRDPVAYTVRVLLSILCEHPETFTPEELASAGETARRLLEFAWKRVPRDSWFVNHALEAVCRTFESNPDASKTLLRRCLQHDHLAKYGFEEMPRLAEEMKRLIPLDPEFVGEVYRAAFAYQEQSDAPTPLGSSRILSLISNRRQDYNMALYQLAEVFPEFLAQAPLIATRALITTMDAYVSQRHLNMSSKTNGEEFDFHGRQARTCMDYSAIWDEGDVYQHDEPIKMLDAFTQYLEQLAERGEDAEKLRKVVEIIVCENRLAVLWRRLLRVGVRFPKTLGRMILPLTWATPIITGIDTSHVAGEFLKTVFSHLPSAERERIERAILSIPDISPEDRHEAGEHIRNRLLGCLTYADLVTVEARRLLADLQAANAVPPNESSVAFDVAEWDIDKGVLVGTEPNRRILELERPVKEFADKHLNSAPTLVEVTAVLPALQALREAVSLADSNGAHPKNYVYAWGTLAAACARIAGTADGLSCEEGTGSFVREVLLEVSRHPEPIHDPETDAQFDENPSWGSPLPRIEATAGLILLARHANYATNGVLQAIEQLSHDSVPAVRFQIAARINELYQTAPNLMWGIIEHLCLEEQSYGVLNGLLVYSISRLARVPTHTDKIVALTKGIFDRVTNGSGANRVRGQCIALFTLLYVWRDHAVCRGIVFQIAQDAARNPDDANEVPKHLSEPLTYGQSGPPDPAQDSIRYRAFDLLARLLRSARDGWRAIESLHADTPFDAWPEADQKKVRSLAYLINSIGDQVYRASGAFDDRQQNTRKNRPLTLEEKVRFYREAGSIIDELADVGLASLAHHLLETLENLIPLDPLGVFLRVGRVIRGGQKGGYQYESLAVDLMVKLLERYLAEYRAIFRESEECRQTLLDILDIFVQAGWPSARRLAYRLEEIFR